MWLKLVLPSGHAFQQLRLLLLQTTANILVEGVGQPTITLEQMTGFSLFMLKAVLSGRGDEIIDLAKINLFR
jgi:hypothetical protein